VERTPPRAGRPCSCPSIQRHHREGPRVSGKRGACRASDAHTFPCRRVCCRSGGIRRDHGRQRLYSDQLTRRSIGCVQEPAVLFLMAILDGHDARLFVRTCRAHAECDVESARDCQGPCARHYVHFVYGHRAHGSRSGPERRLVRNARRGYHASANSGWSADDSKGTIVTVVEASRYSCAGVSIMCRGCHPFRKPTYWRYCCSPRVRAVRPAAQSGHVIDPKTTSTPAAT